MISVIPPNVQDRIAEIKQELDDLDIRRIRPMAENDPAYLTQLTAKIVVLRNELRALLSVPGGV